MSIITKILIAEHDAHDLELMHCELTKSGIQYISEAVINEKQFRSAIQNFRPDLILSDYTFPSFNGITAFEIKEKLAPETPFIVVSGTIGEEKAVELIKSGVTDYVLKDRLFTLSVKIKRALKEAKQKRKKSHADLAFQKALNEYQKIMDSSLDVICTIDEEGKFVNVSSASEKIFGFKPQELKGKKYIDLVFSEDVEITNTTAASIINGTPVTFFENRYTRKDGSVVPIIWSAKWDDNDKLNYCIAKDATEKKRLEKAFETEKQRFYKKIKESERRFRALIENSSDMITLVNSEGVLTYCSPSVNKILGYTLEELLHKPDSEFIHPNDIAAFKNNIKEIIQTPAKSFSNEQRILCKNGKWMWCEGTVTNLLDEQGVHGIVSNFREISERKIAELAQIESKNLLQAIYSASFDAVIIIDQEGIITKWDIKSEQLFGWKEKDVLGIQLSEIIMPVRYREMHTEGMKHYLKTGEGPILGRTIEVCALKKNGVEIDVSLSITPSKVSGITHFIGFIRNISEKKIAEQQRQFDSNNLDALINSTNDLMWSVDRDLKLITFNQPFQNIIKFASGRELAKGDSVLLTALSTEQLNRFQIIYSRVFAGEVFTELEYVDAPVESWSEISYQPILSGNKIVGAACHLHDTTTIKKAEQKIILTEKRFRALVEHGADGVIILSPGGKFNYVSPSIERILGYTEEEAMKLDMFSLFHPDQLAGTAEVWQQVMESPGIPIPGYPIQMLHKNGSWRWLEATLTNMLHDPSINGIVDNYRDVTERKKAEQQREFDQNNLNSLINNTKDLMWSVDRNFKLITSNKPFDDAIMLTSGRLIAKGDGILDPDFSTEQLKVFKRAYECAFEGQSFTEMIYSSIPAETWSEISYCPIISGNEVIGVACHSRDVTQLKINERTIIDERILLRTLIDNLPTIIYTKDINSRKTLSNRKDYEFIGVNAEEEVLGKDDSWFFSYETSKKTKIEEQEIFYTGQPVINKEELQKKKDGSTAWLLNSKIPLRNQHNEVIGLVGIGHDISEIKKTEQQLKKSEAFNRGVLNSLSSHIAVIDAAGNIAAVNEAWKQFGIKNGVTTLQRTAVGSNYYDMCKKSGAIGEEIALEVLQGMKDVMDEKISFFNTEYPCHSPNEQRWFSLRAMKFDNDEPMIVVAHQNITERKLAQEAMSLTQFAVDNAGDAIFWMRPDARIVNINEAACHLLGYTKEETLSLSVPDIDPYYNPEKWSMQFAELQQRKSLFFETIQRAKDGRMVPVEIRTTYIKFGDREFNCAFVRDITERKKAQEHLLKSEAGLKEAQAIARIGNWEADFATNTHTWSDEYHKIFGITKGEAHPSLEYYLSFIHSEDLGHVKKVIELNQRTLSPEPYEFRFIRKDGEMRYGYSQSRFEFDKHNKPIRLYGIIQDVTERKLAEFRLEDQNKELIKANFELDRFVYSVSHELRAPLTSVMGLLTFIEEESKETYTLEYTLLIKNSINRLDSFIRNILAYSRNNRTEPEIKEIQVQKSIDETVDTLRHMKEAEGIHFEVNIQEHALFCSDQQSFKTIMENFISNAIKFQKEEIAGRYIKVTGHSDKHNLYINIKDNGIGIPFKYHDDIFKMFFRLSGKTGGSGIGLYIVKEMIGKLHGSVKVKSKEGAGTSFIITLKNLAH